MEDFELTLFDRLNVIKDTIAKWGEENFYLSFSGGKDSSALSHMIDMACPNNRIPRVYFDTGIEYKLVRDFVLGLASKDDRFVIMKPKTAIKPMLEKVGYPFKSKEHSRLVKVYQRNGMTKSPKRYLDNQDKGRMLHCPKQLRYQFTEENTLKISDSCCYKLKKDIAKAYCKESGRSIAILGLRQAEGGGRLSHDGCVVLEEGKLVKFKPFNPVSDEFVSWFVDKENVRLSDLYYPPYNFKRTGCKGCPYALDLEEQLETMAIYMPEERKQCEIIWAPVYKEYRRLGYRLKKEEQTKLF